MAECGRALQYAGLSVICTGWSLVRQPSEHLPDGTEHVGDIDVRVTYTLVHESAHTFGQIHRGSQRADANACDAAYVAGALADYQRGTTCGGEFQSQDWRREELSEEERATRDVEP